MYQETITFGVLVVLPIQKNLRVSNLMPGMAIAWLAIMFDMIICSTVPSCGSTAARSLAATTPPAPGILRGTMVGSPGM